MANKNPIRRFFQYKPSITRISKSKIKLICLESLVAKNLLAEIPNLINNIKIIPHPIDELEKIQLAKKDKLTIAFVGILSPEKRPELFEQLTQCVNNSKYNFSVIGWAHKPESFNFKNCIHLPSKGPLPQETMQKQLAESDFICMLHEPEHYKLSASGVLLDAIKYKKPILHLNSELVLEIEKTSGQFSISANSIEELAKHLDSVSQADIELFNKNLEKLQVTRHYKYVAEELRALHS